MESCARKIHFCYGHRVMNHENKCANLHGHNAVVWVYATPIKSLDALGRVVDFSVLKEKVGGWIEEHWDHTMILFDQDTTTLKALEGVPRNKDFFLLNCNPTAENLANYLLHVVCPPLLAPYGVIVTKIVFYETENCLAVAEINS